MVLVCFIVFLMYAFLERVSICCVHLCRKRCFTGIGIFVGLMLKMSISQWSDLSGYGQNWVILGHKKQPNFKSICSTWVLGHTWNVKTLSNCISKADSRFALSQWVGALLCNGVSHWLGANLESALYLTGWTWHLLNALALYPWILGWQPLIGSNFIRCGLWATGLGHDRFR